jgi:hypothetical protein
MASGSSERAEAGQTRRVLAVVAGLRDYQAAKNVLAPTSGTPLTWRPHDRSNMTDRRQFLRFLAGSPILAAAGINTRLLQDLTSTSPARAAKALSRAQQALQGAPVISSASEALDVFDFEPRRQGEDPGGSLGLSRHRNR